MTLRSPSLVGLLTVLTMAVTTTLGLLVREREDREILREHVRSERLAAQTGAAGIAAVLDGFNSDLDRLTRLRSVRFLQDPERMNRTLASFRERTTVDSVRLIRVDTTSRILFVYPEGEVPAEALEALRSSGYLKRAARSSESLLSGPVQVPGREELIAFSNLIQPDDSDPLGALIALFPVSSLASPLAGLAEADERSVVLRFDNGTRLRYTGRGTSTMADSAADAASDRFIGRAAVAGEVVPGRGRAVEQPGCGSRAKTQEPSPGAVPSPPHERRHWNGRRLSGSRATDP